MGWNIPGPFRPEKMLLARITMPVNKKLVRMISRGLSICIVIIV
jgi:hypothetical protein